MYRAEMMDTFRRELTRRAGFPGALSFGIAASLNAITTGLGERRRSRRSTTRGDGFSIATLGPDLVQATRALMKARAFTFVSVVSLGVGMGLVIAIVMFLRVITGPPPAINADGIVELLVTPQGDLRTKAGDWAIETWSYPDFEELRAIESGLVLAAWTQDAGAMRTASSGSRQATILYSSADYFRVVGVLPARGSGFTDEPQEPVVMVGPQVWQDVLGSDPNVIGSTLTVNGVAHTIVGVLPPRFSKHLSSEVMASSQLFMPLAQHPRLAGIETVRNKRDVDWVRVLGRLENGASLERANAVVASLMSGLAERHPASNGLKRAIVEPYNPMGARRSTLIVMIRTVFLSASGLVLLIVCLNVSGMVLVRSARREREIAVRLAMGASRRRLIQSLLSESLVLATLGGALAAVVLYGVPQIVVWWNESSIPDPRLQPDAMMVLFCVGLCFVTSLIFGLLPAIRFSRPSLVGALKDESAGGGGRRVGRTQRITAAIQASIAVPFLVISAVKLDQVRTTATAELGFATAGLYSVPLVADVDVNDVQANLLRVPGVESVALADGLPLDFDAREVRLQRDASSATQSAHTTRIGPGYFETMKIPVLRGRSITVEDQRGGAFVVVLSQPLAARLFPDEDPLGKQVTLTFTDTPWPHTVIGVTGDVVASQMASPRPQMYLALSQHPTPGMTLIARAAGPAEAVHAAIEKVLPDVDRNILRASVLTGPGLVRRSQEDLATHSAASAAAAAIALILTALGTFGVIGFMVATRTREIGVRIALGASQSRVLGMVLLDTVKIILPGIAFGLVMAIYVVRADLFEFSMFSLGIVEPLAYLVGAGITIAVALLSGLPTARRAAKVEPITAMRSE